MNIFSVSSDVQDVEILLGELSDKLRQWEGGDKPSLDLTIMLGESVRVSQQVSQLKRQWNLDSWAVIQSTRPRSGPWIIRFQHLVRKMTWWYLEPIIQQVRLFQMNTALTMDSLAQNQESLLVMVQSQAEELAALRQQVETLEAKSGPGDSDQ